MEESGTFLFNLAKKPESSLLVVGTKRQAVPIVEEVLKQVQNDTKQGLNIFTVTKRWMGGTLTNTQAISKNYARLNELTTSINSDEWKQKYTKKELGLFEKDRQKKQIYYGGIAEMKHLPSALFVIDTHTEDLAVKEAKRMGIPVVGIVDTNANPDLVDYVIPANDDAVGSLKLIITYILEAWREGKNAKPDEPKVPEGSKESEGTKDEGKEKTTQKSTTSPKESTKEEKAVKKKKVAKKPTKKAA